MMDLGVRRRLFGQRWLVVVAALAGCGLLQAPALVAAEARVAGLTASAEPSSRSGPLPPQLATADIARYRLIFALQRDGDWAAADRQVDQLGDPALLGHVLAMRYLNRQAYRPTFAELSTWLDRYADLPQAAQIYRLALERKPAAVKSLTAPLDALGADAGTSRSARELWRSAIAAWRAGSTAEAAARFMRLAEDERLEGEDLARAAFWAARADLQVRRPQLVAKLLRTAARGSEGFYGLLAQKMLDDQVDFVRDDTPLNESMLDLLIRQPAAQRALALAEIGETELADREVGGLAARAEPAIGDALLALAAALDLPSAQRELADGGSDELPDRTKFPRIHWQPAGGYRLEPSLVHAVIQAESGFDPDARSTKGALGLMQVMPDTAQHVAKLTRLAYNGEAWLLEPANNMAVGQAWLQQLAGTPTVDNSLLRLVVAYNAGEGRLAGWLAADLGGMEADPLLFIESIPIAETRAYVKKVMANLWAYQAHAGEAVPSLQALAENRWPTVEMAAASVPQPKAKPDAGSP